jgi:DNA-binding transcriptional MerR regulator
MIYSSTGEVARLIGVSKRTLQNWLKLQKINPPQKDVNGYYLWSNDDVRAAQEYKVLLQHSTKYNIGGN